MLVDCWYFSGIVLHAKVIQACSTWYISSMSTHSYNVNVVPLIWYDDRILYLMKINKTNLILNGPGEEDGALTPQHSWQPFKKLIGRDLFSSTRHLYLTTPVVGGKIFPWPGNSPANERISHLSQWKATTLQTSRLLQWAFCLKQSLPTPSFPL